MEAMKTSGIDSWGAFEQELSDMQDRLAMVREMTCKFATDENEIPEPNVRAALRGAVCTLWDVKGTLEEMREFIDLDRSLEK
jgi:hypothetical protein